MSKSVFKGTVSQLSIKDWNGDKGTIQLYSFRIDGNNLYFRTGENKPPFEKGDYVEFEADDRRNNVVMDSIKVKKVEGSNASGAGTANSGGSVRSAKGSAYRSSRDSYWDDKAKRDIEITEPRISFANARTSAISVVNAALANDCIALGSQKGKRLDILLDTIDEVTNKFFIDGMAAHERLASLQEEATAEAQVDKTYDDFEE